MRLRALAVPADGSRHHVAVVFDGISAVTFWLDGTSGTATAPSAVVLRYGTSSSLVISRFAGTQSFAWFGVLDEIAVYPTALGAARIGAHRTAGGL